MKERTCFESEMRALGIYPASNQEIGAHEWGGMGGAEHEFYYEPSYELGVLLDDFQAQAKFPIDALKKIKKSRLFKNMASVIDKNYVSVDEIAKENQPTDMDDDGRLTKATGKFKKKRVLHIQPGVVTEFLRARISDNLATADIINIAVAPQTNAARLEKDWITVLVCMLVHAHNEATAKRIKSASLSQRIRAGIKEQKNIRGMIDEILLDIDSQNKGFNIGILFNKDFKRLTQWIEIGYYPADLLIKGTHILTNLEHCALLECMEESRRRQRLDDKKIDGLRTQIDAKLSKLSNDDVEKEFKALNPNFLADKSHKGDFIASDFETFYFARGLIHRRWQQFLFDPNDLVPLDTNTWKKNIDMRDKRLEHAAKIFPKSLKYDI